jgi:lipopolysaccharide/colanic/teichoic acid biosynthesis glycosyltransferase
MSIRTSTDVSASPNVDRTFRAARKLLQDHLAVLLIVGALCLLPYAYALAAFGPGVLPELTEVHYWHIGINTLANGLCASIALQCRGRLSQRLLHSFISVVFVHVIFIMIFVVTRSYYSRSIMIMAFLGSFSLVYSVLLIGRKTHAARIGMIPNQCPEELLAWIGSERAVLITSPEIIPSNFDIVLANLSKPINAKWGEFIACAMLSGVEVRHVAEYVEELSGRASPDYFDVRHIVDAPERRLYMNFKYLLDVLLVILLLPFALLLGLFTAMAIAVAMGRPVMFVQERVGFGGKPFRMYKFRTMLNGRPKKEEKATSLADARVTPLGRLLRRYRIDEIPQLINVLRGEMSLVGPRPEQSHLCEKYGKSIPAFPYRHLVRPGITGWAQVRFGYAGDEIETREKLSYDLYYTKNMSLLLDLEIVLMTFLVLVHDRSVR